MDALTALVADFSFLSQKLSVDSVASVGLP